MRTLTKAGKKVVIVDLTDGEPTPFGSPEIRAAETARANEILGVGDRELLDLPNREIADSIANRKKLAAVIRKYKPKVLFTHYPEDSHPDHVAAAALTIGARFYAKFTKSDIPGEPCYPGKVVQYLSVHHRIKIIPSFVLDISADFEAKMASIRAYESQFSMNPANTRVFELIERECAYWGSQIGAAYGEPFVTREQVRISGAATLLEI